MLKNYVTIALRHLGKQKGYAFINIAGLAFGVACCLLILLFVQDELNYDGFHEKADQIHRIAYSAVFSGSETAAPLTPSAMAPTLAREYPEVLTATRIYHFPILRTMRYEDRSFIEDAVYFVDSTFFDVFSFPLLRGDPRTAFAARDNVVLTESTARRYFGDEDPLNKSLAFGDAITFTVTGVVADAPPNSHFQFDMLASISSLWGRGIFRDDDWFSDMYYAYFVLQPGADPNALEAKLLDFVGRHMSAAMKAAFGYTFEEYVAKSNFSYSVQALGDIHLRSHLEQELSPNGSITNVYLFIVVALFILLIACINFMNLTTARSAGRALEVGVRKALGAERPQLVRQFLSESMVLSVVAVMLAVGLAAALLPVFNALAHKELTVAALSRPAVPAAMLALALGVGVLAGSYPAFFLSAFRPVMALKGAMQTGAKRSWLRGGLVVFQFAISIVLIIGTVVVFKQLHYAQTKPLGFDKEHVVVIRRANELGAQSEAFRQALRENPRILSAASTTALPGGTTYGYSSIHPEGFADNETVQMWRFFANHDLAEALRLDLVEGRSFSRDFPTDSAAVLINETAARRLGWSDPVGKRMTMGWLSVNDKRDFEVIGVMEDFHFASLHQEIAPVIMMLYPNPLPVMAVRVAPDDLPATLAFIESQWQAFQPGNPFDYSFLDDDFNAQYQAEQQLGQLFTAFAIFAIVIACLGLFGLASFTAEQRRKEIGVRKVHGASAPQIVLLMSAAFTKLVMVALVVAAPVAYFAMQRWLQDFAYRTDLPLWIFLAAGAAALVIAWLTVSYQSIRAALVNPVEALRYE